MARIRVRGTDLGPAFAALVILLCLIPVAVGYGRVRPAWDELYFLHRAVCVNRAAFALDLTALDLCLREMAKSPILSALLLPLGPVAAAPERLALAPAMLALACFAQALVLLRLVAASGMRWAAAIGAAAAAGLALPLREAGAPFLADGLLALIVANTCMLLVAEAAGPRVDGHFRRGMLWGFVIGCGALAKLTFFYFAALLCLPALLLSLRVAGWAASLRKLAGALVVAAVPAFVLLHYAEGLLAHARSFSFGSGAGFYDDGLSRTEFLPRALSSLGAGYWIAVGLLSVAAALWRGKLAQLVTAAWLVAVLAGYLWLSSGSANKDPRFFWPIWVALPFCIAAAASAGPPRRLPGAAMAAGAALAVALSLPAGGRQDLAAVMEADALLATLPGDRPLRVVLASDEPTFNIETMSLGRELHFDRLSRISLGTVVYDVIHGRTLDQSIARLRAADVVIIRDPPQPGAPEWANRSLPRLIEAMQAACPEPTRIGHTTFVYRDC